VKTLPPKVEAVALPRISKQIKKHLQRKQNQVPVAEEAEVPVRDFKVI
jgi:hypothetical protein